MKRTFKKRDVILLLSIAVAALLLYLILGRHAGAGGKTAVVTVGGEVVGEYPLNTDTKVDIKSRNGVNRLIIEGGTAYIEYADCPNQVCVNHKQISAEGESIICVPHNTTVEIK